MALLLGSNGILSVGLCGLFMVGLFGVFSVGLYGVFMDGLYGVFSIGLFWVLISPGIAHMQNIKTTAAHAARLPNFTHVCLDDKKSWKVIYWLIDICFHNLLRRIKIKIVSLQPECNNIASQKTSLGSTTAFSRSVAFCSYRSPVPICFTQFFRVLNSIFCL